MKFFALFIYRPVATILISLAITLCGILGFRLLPVAPLPQVDFPVIMVSASLPGASPETMASSVATPLERSLGRIAGVSEMTSSSSLGSTRIILEFNFDRNINGAARDVQAAINAAQSLLPSGMPSRPTYRKANPSDAPIMILTLTSDTYSQGQLYDFASTQLAQTISQIDASAMWMSAEVRCPRCASISIRRCCLIRACHSMPCVPPSAVPTSVARRAQWMTALNAGKYKRMMS
ncbi:Multidrug efflux system MdtABC-TolC, inner-membrane proton/drug antiporter MdtC (RND type) [Kosakonia radicincitans]|nr:Multidrug efflux system MdtABC-TolC, inner-membrane proton/drug antiporter MdtC (RND type) [Kosakonia radicincitans]